MNQRILTVVSATVDPSREAELLAGFRGLLTAPVPDGLMRTELLRSPTGAWRIQTLWTRCALLPRRPPRHDSSGAWVRTPRLKSSKSWSNTFPTHK